MPKRRRNIRIRIRHRKFSNCKQKKCYGNKTIKKTFLSPRIKKKYFFKGGEGELETASSENELETASSESELETGSDSESDMESSGIVGAISRKVSNLLSWAGFFTKSEIIKLNDTETPIDESVSDATNNNLSRAKRNWSKLKGLVHTGLIFEAASSTETPTITISKILSGGDFVVSKQSDDIQESIYIELDGDKDKINSLFEFFNKDIRSTIKHEKYPQINHVNDFIKYFDNYRIMYKYKEMAEDWLNILTMPKFITKCLGSRSTIIEQSNIDAMKTNYSLHLALIFYMLKIPYLKYNSETAIDYLDSDDVSKGQILKNILCDIYDPQRINSVFLDLFKYVETKFHDKFARDRVITRGLLSKKDFTSISEDIRINLDEAFRAYVMSNGDPELTKQFLESSQTKYQSVIAIPRNTINLVNAKTLGESFKDAFKRIGTMSGGTYGTTTSEAVGSTTQSYTLDSLQTCLNIIGTYAFNDTDFQDDSAHDDTTMRTANEDNDFVKGLSWTSEKIMFTPDKNNWEKLLSTYGYFYLIERGTGIVDITDNGEFYIPNDLPNWRYIIDAGGWKKAFPIFKNDCPTQGTTYNLCNLTDPASTGSGQFYICYNELANAAINSDVPWKPAIESITDNNTKSQIGATIFIRLLIEFMKSIINNSKQVDDDLTIIEDKTVINKIWEFLSEEIFVVGTEGDNILFSSFSETSDDATFSWEGKQPNMARYIQYYSSIGGKTSTTAGAKARGSNKDIGNPNGTSGMVDAFINYISKDRSILEYHNTLIILFCRILKYAGDKSHIVCAILLMFLNERPTPYIILTLDRLLGKAIIQAIEFSRYVGETNTWGGNVLSLPDEIRNMIKTIGNKLGVSLAANGEVHSLLKSLDSYKELQSYQNSENRYGEVFLYKLPDDPLVTKCNKFISASKSIQEAEKIITDNDADLYTVSENNGSFQTVNTEANKEDVSNSVKEIEKYLSGTISELTDDILDKLDNYPEIIIQAQAIVLHRENQIQEYKDKIINDRIINELQEKYFKYIPSGRSGRKPQNYQNIEKLRNQFPFTMKRGRVKILTKITLSYDESLKQFYKIVFAYNQQKTNKNYPSNEKFRLSEKQKEFIEKNCEIIYNYYSAIIDNWTDKDNTPDMKEISEYIVDIDFMDVKTGSKKFFVEGINDLPVVTKYISEPTQHKRVISNVESYIVDVMSILREVFKVVSVDDLEQTDSMDSSSFVTLLRTLSEKRKVKDKPSPPPKRQSSS